MNWDWDKLSEQRQRNTGSKTPGVDEINSTIKKFRGTGLPGGKYVIIGIIVLWFLSGVYIVEPDEVGVVTRFGKYVATTNPGPHYHLPVPIESVMKPQVTRIRRVEVGFRSFGSSRSFTQGQSRNVPEESLMLTGDENIVDVQFIVQYQIKDPVEYLFKVTNQDKTLQDAAEAAMREIIGKTKIELALTTGKLQIQTETRALLQSIVDSYELGVNVLAVQLQNVHPPAEVVDAFKDVASAREDKSRYINEAEAYRNDILPKARGQAAVILNRAEAYKETKVRKAEGQAKRFMAVYREYTKAKDVTVKRLYLETMENILSNPDVTKVILSDSAAKRALPFLSLDGGSFPVKAITNKKGVK
ncbi:membrane protease subunit HflK [Maridesulfovibrio ferrireducens]|uniref:Protein HflK n=1 Tax=Maridesulfovibrio ferrireducens TaxID=246191 RepID=A0A1G9BNL1_9BACT|nr:FtsH protease activity modulator HflK [Maridesulfovibrio ferrireducens]SDK41003.1 membrane protease subunit HflK [Maridesulfovibrio ferrireducens]